MHNQKIVFMVFNVKHTCEGLFVSSALNCDDKVRNLGFGLQYNKTRTETKTKTKITLDFLILSHSDAFSFFFSIKLMIFIAHCKPKLILFYLTATLSLLTLFSVSCFPLN